MASLAQIGLFVLLGLLVSPSRLAEAVGPALLVGGALLLVARPLSVGLSLVWFRFPWTQQLFISWAGLRGAVPIVLATFPLTAEVPGAAFVFDTCSCWSSSSPWCRAGRCPGSPGAWGSPPR